jgi:SAM-dependent methyltransferase
MDEWYLRSLAALKDTFLGGNESQVLAEAILECHSNQHLTLLDIGTGTGRSLIEIVGRLRDNGLSVDATAVDIFFSPDAADRLKTRDILPLQIDFGEFASAAKFDVILATQSLYYFADLHGSLGRMCELLSATGLLCLTLWNEQCILRKVAIEVFGGEASMVLSPRLVLEYLEKNQRFRRLSSRAVVGPVAINQWIASEDVLRGAAIVLSRRLAPEVQQDEIERLRTVVEKLGSIENRSNSIIFAYREDGNIADR